MLTFNDCLDFSELTEDVILAIAEHEHMPDIVAAELGCCLLKTEDGIGVIKRYLLEDIEIAEAHGLRYKAAHWLETYQRFSIAHPN